MTLSNFFRKLFGFFRPAPKSAEPRPPVEPVTVVEVAGIEMPVPADPIPTEQPTVIEVAGIEMPAPPPTQPPTDPEPLPDSDPEPVPITEPEPMPQPEPPPPPPEPQPTIIVADERPRESVIIAEPKSEKKRMSRIVKGGLIQTSLACDTSESLETIRIAQTERTLKYIDQAGAEGVQVLCMQEIFTGPYFCAEQTTRWYDSTEKIPDGPTTILMQEYAKKYSMVIVVPLYEVEETGVYYNTAAVIDADGKYLGKYRKNHIPHVAPGFWEKFYFRPGNLGYPVFDTAYAKVGVYICYDRHFPEGARELGLAGAEIVMNPSATVAGLSEYLWKLEQPAHAVANGYFVGAINRVGFEAPWNIGEFYGQSYFCDPRGQMLAVGPRDQDALVTADLDMDKIREVRNTWQFYRDRRPETYNGIVRL
ncbi:MAG: beta-ureidopropionase [Thermoanaerobaculia bacterium]|nr:beta-ureidopropionase [Thermoanaerobaculia bacterium]